MLLRLLAWLGRTLLYTAYLAPLFILIILCSGEKFVNVARENKRHASACVQAAEVQELIRQVGLAPTKAKNIVNMSKVHQ